MPCMNRHRTSTLYYHSKVRTNLHKPRITSFIVCVTGMNWCEAVSERVRRFVNLQFHALQEACCWESFPLFKNKILTVESIRRFSPMSNQKKPDDLQSTQEQAMNRNLRGTRFLSFFKRKWWSLTACSTLCVLHDVAGVSYFDCRTCANHDGMSDSVVTKKSYRSSPSTSDWLKKSRKINHPQKKESHTTTQTNKKTTTATNNRKNGYGINWFNQVRRRWWRCRR